MSTVTLQARIRVLTGQRVVKKRFLSGDVMREKKNAAEDPNWGGSKGIPCHLT